MIPEPAVDNDDHLAHAPADDAVDRPHTQPVNTGDNFCVGAVSPPAVHVMSYNVRCERTFQTEPGDPDHWPDRRPLLVEVLGREQPTILGLQEVRFGQISAVTEALPSHRVVGYGRNGGSDGEHNLLLIDPDRFELLAWDQLWLSDTPRLVGSATWDTDITRVLVWARLRDRGTGRDLIAINTHLDHQGPTARMRGAEQLRDLIASEFAGLPVVLTGDFNTGAGTPPYAVLTGAGLQDSWEVADERITPAVATFAGYDEPTPDGVRIDWILAGGGLGVRAAAINPARIGGLFPSDHLPIHAVVELPAG